MAWTTPSTVTAGQTLAASFWNEQVRDNMMAGHPIVTSSTRPSSPFEGQMIYETDTQKALIYSGSDWVEIADIDYPMYRYYSESLSEQSTTNGYSNAVTAFTSSEMNVPGTGILTALFEAEVKASSSYSVYVDLGINSGGTYRIINSNINYWSNGTSIMSYNAGSAQGNNTNYEIITATVFPFSNKFAQSSTDNVQFRLRYGGNIAGGNLAYIKNIKFSLIYNRHF